MTIPFTCSCGKSFQAKDEFAGKRTKCPACGEVLVIPPATRAAPPGQPPAMIHFRCECGKEFKVRSEFAGRSTKCPACGHTLVIPGRPMAVAPTLAEERHRPEIPDAEPPEEYAADQLPEKKKPARPRSRTPLLIGGAVLALLLAAGGVGGFRIYKQIYDAGKPLPRNPHPPVERAEDPQEKAEKEALAKANLPEDLSLVPLDALAFVSVRVGDWWNSPLSQQLRRQMAPLLLFGGIPAPERQMEQLVGLTPTDIERATLVVPVLSPKIMWAVVSTRKPYDRAKLLQAFGPTAEKSHRGKTYHFSEAQNTALYFAKDRLLVLGTQEGVQHFLQGSPPPDTRPMIPAVLAANQHQVTAAVANPPALILKEMVLPEPLKPYDALLNVHRATLTIDAGNDLQVEAKLDYRDEATTKKAEEAVQGLLKLGRDNLAVLKKEMTQGADDKALQPLFSLVDSLVQNIPVGRQGSTVQVQWKVEAAAVAQAPALLLPAVQKVRMSANRLKSLNNLKQLMLAMHNYHDQHNHFPSAVVTDKDGRPLYSWRVELLPYLEQRDLYQEFHKDEPWDSPHNRKLLAKMPAVFALEGVSTKEPGSTFFQLVVGPGTPYGGPKPPQVPGSFPAGTSQTLLIVTAAEAVPWTKPVDLAYTPDGPPPKLGKQFGGPLVAFADGSVRVLEPTTDEKMLRKLIAPPAGAPK